MGAVSRSDDKGRNDRSSVERYLLMSEKEKDEEIQKAVLRLQKQIQEILYILEADKQQPTVRRLDKEKKARAENSGTAD